MQPRRPQSIAVAASLPLPRNGFADLLPRRGARAFLAKQEARLGPSSARSGLTVRVVRLAA